MNNPISAPIKVRILLTSTCNRSCFYCHNEGQSLSINFLTLDRIKEVIKRFDPSDTRFIISGGEPTLHPGYMEIVHYLRSLKPLSLELVTNGSNPDKVSLTLPVLDKVKLHVDGYTKEEHRKVSNDRLFHNLMQSVNLLSHHSNKVITETPLVNKTTALSVIHQNVVNYGFTSKILQVRSKGMYPSITDLHGPLILYSFRSKKISSNKTEYTLGNSERKVILSSLPIDESVGKSYFLHADGTLSHGFRAITKEFVAA